MRSVYLGGTHTYAYSSTADTKEWIVNKDPDIIHVPFPNCNKCPWGKNNYDSCDEYCVNQTINYLMMVQ